MGQLECKSRREVPYRTRQLIHSILSRRYHDADGGSLVGRLPLYAVRCAASEDGYAHLQGKVLEYGQLELRSGGGELFLGSGYTERSMRSICADIEYRT